MKSSKTRILGIAIAIMALILSQKSAAQMKPMDGSQMTMSRYSYGETVDILKGAIEEQNLMVIHEVDAQKMLRMAGKQVDGMSQIFYFHPKYMRRVMEANPAATIQIPLKFIVMEKPDGKVVIRYFKPSTILNNYKGEESISAELDGLVEKILTEVTN
tara:strand:+ start:279 stop:752 length:474 start_codon:yes stop_codon:yes gene_type:complete